MAETKIEQRVRELELELDAESHENAYLRKQVEDIGKSQLAVEGRMAETELQQAKFRVHLDHLVQRTDRLADSQKASDKSIEVFGTDIAVLRQRLDENCRQTEKMDSRLWWFFTAIIGMQFAIITGLIVALVKR